MYAIRAAAMPHGLLQADSRDLSPGGCRVRNSGKFIGRTVCFLFHHRGLPGRMVCLSARQVSAGKSPAAKGRASVISLNPPDRLPENSVSAALCAARMR